MFCSASTYYVVPVILAVWAPLAPGSRMFLSCLFFTISLVTSELPFYQFSIFFDIPSGKAQTFFSVIYHVKALIFVDFAPFLQIFPQFCPYFSRRFHVTICKFVFPFADSFFGYTCIFAKSRVTFKRPFS